LSVLRTIFSGLLQVYTSGGRTRDMGDLVPVTVHDGADETTIEVPAGTVLRDALLNHDFEVYGSVSRMANCGGRGLCGTCGVRIAESVPAAGYHDAAAKQWGYPRLSCRIRVTEPLTVTLVEKAVWGQLLPD
jgi:ferredoxin